MKSSFLKVFAGHFQRYQKWLKVQKIPEPRKRQMATRANHHLAYLTLSTSDYSKIFTDASVKSRAWRVYRRFLRESMNYDEEMLDGAFEELSHFYEFAGQPARPTLRLQSVGQERAKEADLSVSILQAKRGRERKQLSARPGGRQKTASKRQNNAKS